MELIKIKQILTYLNLDQGRFFTNNLLMWKTLCPPGKEGTCLQRPAFIKVLDYPSQTFIKLKFDCIFYRLNYLLRYQDYKEKMYLFLEGVRWYWKCWGDVHTVGEGVQSTSTAQF